MSRLVFALLVAGVSANQGIIPSYRPLPPGIATFVSSTLGNLQDYELDLHPPEEDRRIAADQLNALKAIEVQADKAAEADIIASKQRLLNAEIASIRSIVAANVQRPAGFLQRLDDMISPASLFGTMVGHSDFQLNIHPHEELQGDIKSHADAILKVEDAKQATASAAFVADKKRILQAGLGEMRRIVADAVAPVHGKFSGLALSERMAPIAILPLISEQLNWQAGMPSEVHVNYDVPTFGVSSEAQQAKAATEALNVVP